MTHQLRRLSLCRSNDQYETIVITKVRCNYIEILHVWVLSFITSPAIVRPFFTRFYYKKKYISLNFNVQMLKISLSPPLPRYTRQTSSPHMRCVTTKRPISTGGFSNLLLLGVSDWRCTNQFLLFRFSFPREGRNRFMRRQAILLWILALLLRRVI